MSLYNLLSLAFSAVVALPAPQATEPLGAVVVPGKYIVTLKEDAIPPSIDSHLSWVQDIHARSLSKRDEKGVDKIWKKSFKGYSGEFDEETIASISGSDDVVAVEPVKIMRQSEAFDYPNIISQKPSTWGLGSISHRTPNWTEYLYDSSAGEGTWAYVIDTGIYTEHDEFEGRAHLGYNAVEWADFVDDTGHGTHCSGTLAGKTYGVAKKAQLIGVKVFQDDSAPTDTVIDGFEWAVSNITATPGRAAISVISMSLSGELSEAFNTAIRTAYNEHNVLSVVAAGNFGYRASLFSPAAEETAITVAAIEPNNYRPLFSNWGPAVDIFAPGTNVLSAYIGAKDATFSQSGTSMATPHVSGLVLYLRALESGLETAAAVTDRIKELATKDVVDNAAEGTPNLLAFNGVKGFGYN